MLQSTGSQSQTQLRNLNNNNPLTSSFLNLDYFFFLATQLVGSCLPDQGLNPGSTVKTHNSNPWTIREFPINVS